MSDSNTSERVVAPVPGSVKINRYNRRNPNIIRIHKKNLRVFAVASLLFLLIIFSICVYLANQMTQKDELISKLETKLNVAVRVVCKKDTHEVMFIRRNEDDGNTKTIIVCDKEIRN